MSRGATTASMKIAATVILWETGTGYETPKFGGSFLLGRRALLMATLGSTQLMNLGWGYTAGQDNGNVVSQTIARTIPVVGGSPVTYSFSQSFGYVDPANRLASANEGSAWSQTYGYDAFGNRAVTAGVWNQNGVTGATMPNPGYTPQHGKRGQPEPPHRSITCGFARRRFAPAEGMTRYARMEAVLGTLVPVWERAEARELARFRLLPGSAKFRERYANPILRSSAGWRTIGTCESGDLRRGRNGVDWSRSRSGVGQAWQGSARSAVCAPHFFAWKKRLRHAAADQLVEVQLVGTGMAAEVAAAHGKTFEIQFGGGRIVVSEPGFARLSALGREGRNGLRVAPPQPFAKRFRQPVRRIDRLRPASSSAARTRITARSASACSPQWRLGNSSFGSARSNRAGVAASTRACLLSDLAISRVRRGLADGVWSVRRNQRGGALW
jgi:YD repeat-containing protein